MSVYRGRVVDFASSDSSVLKSLRGMYDDAWLQISTALLALEGYGLGDQPMSIDQASIISRPLREKHSPLNGLYKGGRLDMGCGEMRAGSADSAGG